MTNIPVELFLEIPTDMKMWFLTHNRVPKLTTTQLGTIDSIARATYLEREFLGKVNKQSGVRRNNLTTECWEWTGATYGNGYGEIKEDRYGDGYAHRWSYSHFKGEIPDGKLIRHQCDHRLCVNPDHLEIGEKKENNQECRERNSRACGRKLQPSEYPKIVERMNQGELLKDIALDYQMNWKSISRALKKAEIRPAYNHNQTITPEQIAQMKQMRQDGKSYYAIAREMGVSQSSVYNLVGEQ